MKTHEIIYDLTATIDYKELIEKLLTYIEKDAKTNKICITLFYEEHIFIESKGFEKEAINHFKDETKWRKSQGIYSREKVIHYQNQTVGICIEDETIYYGMLFVEGCENEDLLIFLAYVSMITIKKFRLEQVNQEMLVKEEQARIADEIHDSILQKLFGLSCHAFAIAKKTEDYRLKEEIDDLREELTDVMGELRRTVYGMSWVEGENDQLMGKLNRYIAFTEKYYHAKIEVVLTGEIEKLENFYEKMLYRITCEAIANAIRHGKAKYITLHLNKTYEGISLIIKDDGRGFDYKEVVTSGRCGIGMSNMRQLVEGAGGIFSVISQLEKGTKIQVALPTAYREEGIG